jgi:hypothetical protein
MIAVIGLVVGIKVGTNAVPATTLKGSWYELEGRDECDRHPGHTYALLRA